MIQVYHWNRLNYQGLFPRCRESFQCWAAPRQCLLEGLGCHQWIEMFLMPVIGKQNTKKKKKINILIYWKIHFKYINKKYIFLNKPVIEITFTIEKETLNSQNFFFSIQISK